MNKRMRGLATVASCALAMLCPRHAASEEITIPRGTAVDVLVEDALSSRTAKVGDQFRAVLVRALWIDGRLAFPKGTIVDGLVDVVKSRADGARYGFVGVKFVRIELPRSPEEKVAARLADFGLKPERVDVVLIGRVVPAHRRTQLEEERGKESARLQTSDTDVEVAAGTLVSLEFGEAVQVPSAPTDAAAPIAGRVYSTPDTVAAVQRALRQQGRYEGAIDGALGTETRQAIIQFQLDHGQVATGELNDETMRLLGVKGDI